MTEEEKKAIEWLKKAEFFSARLYAPIILNLIDKQQKEIEFFKKQELTYMAGYYNGKANQETATAIRFESNRYEQFQKHIEELRNKNTELRDKLNEKQEEIKELKLITNGYDSYLGENMGGYKIIIADSKYFMNGTFVNKFISKDKIKEILELAYKDNYEMVKLPNNNFMCVSDCEDLLDYLKELLEER